jgi:predicted metal-dependent hydrolase
MRRRPPSCPRSAPRRASQNPPESRLLLNCRLIEAPIDGIDYVITHELCHLAVPHHGPEFFELLGRVLPDWESRKHRLEEKMA